MTDRFCKEKPIEVEDILRHSKKAESLKMTPKKIE